MYNMDVRVDFSCREFSQASASVEDEMSAQEATSLETAIESQLNPIDPFTV